MIKVQLVHFPTCVDLPTDMYYGSKMSPTADGKGLLLSYEKSIYEFNCQTETNCWFTETDIELQISRIFHLMFQVPSTLLNEC